MKSSNYKYLGFNDFWITIIGILVLSFIIPPIFFGENLSKGLKPFLGSVMITLYFSTIYWLGTRFILLKIRQKYQHFEDASKRIMLQVLLAIGYAFFASNISKELLCFLIGNEDESVPLSGVFAPYITILLMIAVYESIYFYYQLKLSIQEKEEVRRAQLRSELEGLRNQVNPHFLFNSLNTLMNIVAEDQNLAISFLKRLSKVYRYVLDNRREQLIPLSTEMEFMESYIFLQKERFQSNLNIEMNVPSAYLNHQIIPLAMQILFENAIKHNIVSSKKPLTIRVFVVDEKLVIENNLQRKNTVMPGTQVGLENVKTRYRIFTEREVEILETELAFRVALPLIPKYLSS
ncbi:MAG: two-component system LytT family sensor kinase [Paraglaciecola sp.]|jgi:two-component system LytT family sensor kinase